MELNFKKIGETGRPLVILHGLFGSLDNWQSLGRKFSERHVVYLVDQRNHGHSPHSTSHTYEEMAEDLIALFEAEGIADAVLVGHSMGGKTAMVFAQKRPDLLHGLIVVDMGIKSYPPHHTQILKGLNSIDLNALKSRGEADKQLAEYVPEIGVRQFLLKNMYWVEKGQLGWRFNLPVLEREMPQILKAISDKQVNVPTLFIAGSKSEYIVPADHEALKAVFPHAEVQVIEDAGHWVHAEAPGPFFEAVSDFSA